MPQEHYLRVEQKISKWKRIEHGIYPLGWLFLTVGIGLGFPETLPGWMPYFLPVAWFWFAYRTLHFWGGI